jgi:hypothetical protein
MIVIISISTLLMGLAVVVLQGLLVAERTSKESQERQAAFRRLADDFRRDVHAAREAKSDASGLTLRDFSPGGPLSVRYEVNHHEVERLEEKNGGVNCRESYVLAADAFFDREAKGSMRLIKFYLVLPEQRSPENSLTPNVEAVLGSDRRFEKQDIKNP